MSQLIIRRLGRVDYETTWHAMQQFTEQRDTHTPDEFWLVEHAPVFTQGQAGKPHHLLDPGTIPVIPTDRGGQVTYHGPGQVIIYVLLDLRRHKLGIRSLVTLLEESIIALVASFGILAEAKSDAPGVYVNDEKLASIGLRVRKHCSYHGLSLNVAMDLEPFKRINPCGYQGLVMTQLSQLGITLTLEQVAEHLAKRLAQQIGFQTRQIEWTSIPYDS